MHTPPKIGFDVSPLVRPHSRGVAHLVQHLVEALERRGGLHVVRLLPEAGRNLRAWRQKDLPAIERNAGLVGVHSFVSAFALAGAGKRVQTVHELPWRHGVKENADLRHRLWARIGLARASRVVCASEFVARDLGSQWLASTRNVRVIPWGVGAPFQAQPALDAFDEPLLGKYRLGQDALIVAPGAVRAKKGLDRLLHGVAEFRRRGGPRVQVVATGEHTLDLRRDLGLASKLGLASAVSTPGVVADEDLPGLLRLASVVAVLSRSEGFSFPVLQAMASGTQPLVPLDSAQAELAGPAGVAVMADDPAAVASGIERALAKRTAARAALLARAGEFSWETAAQRVEALWLKIL